MGEVSQQSTTEVLEGNGQGMLAANLESPRFVGNSNPRDSAMDFEAIIKDIDNAILEDHHNLNPVVTKIIQNLNRKGKDIIEEGQPTGSQALIKEDSKIRDMGEVEQVQNLKVFKWGGQRKK